MENRDFVIEEMYDIGKKQFLRIFSKVLPFYSMPISDYFVSTQGYINMLVVDFYADLIFILEED